MDRCAGTERSDSLSPWFDDIWKAMVVLPVGTRSYSRVVRRILRASALGLVPD